MANATIKARVKQKIDTEQNWNAKTSFVPLRGEIIIYDRDENHPIQRMKIGDGNAYLLDLPFFEAGVPVTQQDIARWDEAVTVTYEDGQLIFIEVKDLQIE